jgi:hypothetical protein
MSTVTSAAARKRRELEKSIQRIAAEAFARGFNQAATTAAALNPNGTAARTARAYFAALAEVLCDRAARAPLGWAPRNREAEV